MSEKEDTKQEKQIKKSIFGENASNEKCETAIDYYYGLIEKDVMTKNLVDGAWLTCEKATAIMMRMQEELADILCNYQKHGICFHGMTLSILQRIIFQN